MHFYFKLFNFFGNGERSLAWSLFLSNTTVNITVLAKPQMDKVIYSHLSRFYRKYDHYGFEIRSVIVINDISRDFIVNMTEI